MSQYQRLLLILNPAQRHSPALHHAAALAAASGAHLHVIALIPSLDILSLLEEGPPRTVVAAVDPSSAFAQNSGLNDRIIRQAMGLALQCDAELHLVHAYEVSSVYLGDAGGGGLSLSQLSKELRRSLEKTFLELANLFGVPAERRHFLLGHPVSALSEFALEHEVDVIVMGRFQHDDLYGLLGSTTEHILYQVSCSVLAV